MTKPSLRHCSGSSWRNLLLANERRQRITPAQTAAALNLVQELPLRLDGQADSDTTLQLARAHKLTIYDPAYLQLAVRRHLPLVTFDTTLAEAARSEKRERSAGSQEF